MVCPDKVPFISDPALITNEVDKPHLENFLKKNPTKALPNAWMIMCWIQESFLLTEKIPSPKQDYFFHTPPMATQVVPQNPASGDQNTWKNRVRGQCSTEFMRVLMLVHFSSFGCFQSLSWKLFSSCVGVPTESTLCHMHEIFLKWERNECNWNVICSNGNAQTVHSVWKLDVSSKAK